jgi:hypothetical protein
MREKSDYADCLKNIITHRQSFTSLVLMNSIFLLIIMVKTSAVGGDANSGMRDSSVLATLI